MQGAGFKGAGCGDLDRKASPSCWRGSPNPNRARIARGGKNHLTTGVTSPLQGAEAQNPHFSSLKRGRDPGIQTICLSPRYPGKDPQVKSKQRGMGRQRLVEQHLRHMQANKLSKSLAYTERLGCEAPRRLSFWWTGSRGVEVSKRHGLRPPPFRARVDTFAPHIQHVNL